MASFNEQDHPRGHPDNAGGFSSRSLTGKEVRLSAPKPWPPLSYENLMWTSRTAESGPAASVASRLNGTYQSAVPAHIRDLPVDLPSDTLQLAEEATAVLVRFDSELGSEIAPFASLLLRSEAAASSRIENLTASAR